MAKPCENFLFRLFTCFLHNNIIVISHKEHNFEYDKNFIHPKKQKCDIT